MFQYIGGKNRQARWINSFIPDELTRYSEIFGGAMWCYIKQKKRRWNEVYYNDVNRFLSNVFTCFKQPEILVPMLKQHNELPDRINLARLIVRLPPISDH